jgi:twitching motility protein PilT
MRKLENYIRSIEDLGLPDIFYNMAKEKNGIILVTGATGTGKTTTLAAILDEVNASTAVHVVTLEDPVEFIHTPKMSTFNQRELGTDFRNFSEGLRSALRQAPKVILVGEMRDRETVEMALSAAETGHLVFSTLHTVDAGTTVNRIVGMFDHDEEKLIRVRLADTFRWIVSQRLLPRIGGGRIAALEIMGTSLLIKDIITNGEAPEKTFYGAIESMRPLGFQTFDQHILDLFSEKQITEETAKTFSSKKNIMARGIDNLKALAGESVFGLEFLSLEPNESDEEASAAEQPNLASAPPPQGQAQHQAGQQNSAGGGRRS